MKPRAWTWLSLLIPLLLSVPASALTPAFHILINGEESNTVTVEAAPNTFAVYIVVKDEDNGTTLAANVVFVLEAFREDLSGPGLGTLSINFGQTISGECLIYDSYTKAENIYLRVRDAGGSPSPLPDYSPLLEVYPSSPANSLIWAEPPAQYSFGSDSYAIPCNVTDLVQVRILDANDNPVSGLPVDFTIVTSAVSSTLTASGSNTTDATGLASVQLLTGPAVESFDVKASAGSLEPTIHINLFIPTATPTITLTPTPTPTFTVTPTATVTPTVTISSEQAEVDLQGRAVIGFPNPGQDRITFALRTSGADEIKVEIYNPNGERVALLSAQANPNNGTSVAWDCSAVAPGVYLVRLVQNGKEIGKSKVAVVRE
jgi:hypothetical protein